MNRLAEYNEIRPNLKTGDLVLFSGEGLVSTGIKVSTFSKWSHVGMVFEIPEHDLIMLWESTTMSKMKDFDSGEVLKGVQLVPLSERIKVFNGDIGIRCLKNKLTKHQLQRVSQLRHEFKGRPYEQNKIELILAALPGHIDEDLSSLFCSELIAEVLQEIILLSDGRPSNDYNPGDFDEGKTPELDNWYKGLLEL